MAAGEPGKPRWLVVRVRSPSEESASWLAEGLVAYGASAVLEEGDDLVTWFKEPPDAGAFLDALARSLESCAGEPVRLAREWRAGDDWARTWRTGLAPRRIGRVTVTPTWCAPEPASGEVVVAIDPQMAFGTGEHATTRGALRLLQGVLRGGDAVLDVGTGSAVLAIAAARLGAGAVTAVEHDADALVCARQNVEHNGCARTVTLEEATVDEAWLRNRGGPFDVIVANILSGVLLPLLPPFRASLREGGHAILAGLLEKEAATVRAAAFAAGFRVVAEDREQEWWSVTLVAGRSG